MSDPIVDPLPDPVVPIDPKDLSEVQQAIEAEAQTSSVYEENAGFGQTTYLLNRPYTGWVSNGGGSYSYIEENRQVTLVAGPGPLVFGQGPPPPPEE